MIKSITAINYLGQEFKMVLADPSSSGIIISKITGLGPAKADINTTEISTSDGSLFNSSRVNSRNIVMTVQYMFKDSIEDVRQLSYKYFPIKRKVTLLIETSNRKVTIDGYVEKNEPDIFSKKESAQISIICPDPYFYSTSNDVTMFSGIDPLFSFPWSNESTSEKLIEIGAVVNKKRYYVSYSGDADTGITMIMHSLGIVTNPIIYNVKTHEHIAIDTTKLATLTGSGIIAKDTITIVTTTGEKSITLLREGVETNILNCIGKDSDWFKLTKGDNIFTFTADLGSELLQFGIESRVLYEGV